MIEPLWSNIAVGTAVEFRRRAHGLPAARRAALRLMADAQVFWRTASHNMLTCRFLLRHAGDMERRPEPDVWNLCAGAMVASASGFRLRGGVMPVILWMSGWRRAIFITTTSRTDAMQKHLSYRG